METFVEANGHGLTNPHMTAIDCRPRILTLDEERALTDWIQVTYGADHSDACGMLEASHIAVYDHCGRFVPKYTGTIIVVMNYHDGVQIFSVHDEAIHLEREYKSI